MHLQAAISIMSVVIGYFASWTVYEPENYSPFDIPVEKLTHLNYAFANITGNSIIVGDQWGDIDRPYTLDDGTILNGAIAVLNDPRSPLRKRNPTLKTLISVGGWNNSVGFSPAVRTSENRTTFAKSIVDFVVKHNFDGVDIDWEYPVEGGPDPNMGHANDTENFGELLKLIRSGLDNSSTAGNRSEPYLITLATSADPDKIKHLPTDIIKKSCNYINVMTYDGSGPWSETNEHHAALETTVVSAIEGYLEHGYPPGMLTLGLPFYGRLFRGVTKSSETGQPYVKFGEDEQENSIVDYNHLITERLAENGYNVTYLPQSCVTVHWNKEDGNWISGESVESIKCKTTYASDKHLAGVFMWHIGMDKRLDLLNAIDSSRKGKKTP